LVAAATSFEGSETNFRLIIYKQSPTNSANLMKIGLVDVEIITCQTEVVKIIYNK